MRKLEVSVGRSRVLLGVREFFPARVFKHPKSRIGGRTNDFRLNREVGLRFRLAGFPHLTSQVFFKGAFVNHTARVQRTR